jgi:hypothetical protein
MDDELIHIGDLYESIACEVRCLNYKEFREAAGKHNSPLTIEKPKQESTELYDIIEKVKNGEMIEAHFVKIQEMGLKAKIPFLMIIPDERVYVTTSKYISKAYLAPRIEINTMALMVHRAFEKADITLPRIIMSINSLKPEEKGKNVFQQLLNPPVAYDYIAPYLSRLMEIKFDDIELNEPRSNCSSCWAKEPCGGFRSYIEKNY